MRAAGGGGAADAMMDLLPISVHQARRVMEESASSTVWMWRCALCAARLLRTVTVGGRQRNRGGRRGLERSEVESEWWIEGVA